jgi:hypothetical protein
MKIDSKISMLIEGYPRNGYQTYSMISGRSTGGLCISRLHPDYVAQKYALDTAKRYWLTNQRGEDTIAPKSLHQLVKAIRLELRGRSGGTIFMDGLEYLLIFNDISKVIAALDEIADLLKAANEELIMSIDPLTFEQRDLDKLWASFPRYTSEELMAKHSVAQPQHVPTVSTISVGREVSSIKV